MNATSDAITLAEGELVLFLCGDVMTGRGIDQVLPHPGDPRLYESYMDDARDYVAIAERANGPIPAPVPFEYVWGQVLAELQQHAPHYRIVNLETSVTTSCHPEPKGINYKMHPRNVPCLTALGIDCCSLANNHVLDWGEAGLLETLKTLHRAGLKTAGAGTARKQAQAPAVLEANGRGRVLVYAFGSESSGIPPSWAAGRDRAGVDLLSGFSHREISEIRARVTQQRRPDDLVIASIHWGGNWGYPIPEEHRWFAHALIDHAMVDVVHGHSSHHAKAIEVYRGKPILYGCGDFLNDYEGIAGHDSFRDDLPLMYFVHMTAAPRRLARLRMVPLEIKNFSLRRASEPDRRWLAGTLNREGAPLGTWVEADSEATLDLHWT